MREEMPTIPEDLSEYALEQTGPDSWSSFSTIDDELCIDEDSFVAGPLLGVRRDDVAQVLVGLNASKHYGLEPREGFVLGLLEHYTTDVETLLDIAGFPEHETLGVLCKLCEKGVVSIERG